MHTSDLLIGLTAPALQLLLIGILASRKIYRRFPFFFAYTVYSIAAAVVLTVVIIRFPTRYYEFYWITQFIYGLLALLAIIEVFESVLRLFGFDGWGWRVLLPSAILIIAAISVSRALYHPLYGQANPLAHLAAGAYAFQLSVHCLQAGILLLCLTPRRRYGVLWHYDTGIVAGLGFYAFVSLVAAVIGLKLGGRFEPVFRYLPAGAYIGAVIVWLFVFVRPEPPRPRLKMTVEERLTLVRRLTAIVKKYWDIFDSAPCLQK